MDAGTTVSAAIGIILLVGFVWVLRRFLGWLQDLLGPSYPVYRPLDDICPSCRGTLRLPGSTRALSCSCVFRHPGRRG